jgi:hypothetical protein
MEVVRRSIDGFVEEHLAYSRAIAEDVADLRICFGLSH